MADQISIEELELTNSYEESLKQLDEVLVELRAHKAPLVTSLEAFPLYFRIPIVVVIIFGCYSYV